MPVGDRQRSVDSCDIELIADIISLGIADNGSTGNLYRICSGVSARTLSVKTRDSEFVSVNYEIQSLEAGDGLLGSVPNKGAGFCIDRDCDIKKTRLTDSSFLFTGQNNRFLFHNNFQLFNNIFNVAAQSCLRHAYHMDVASIDRQQHLMGMASPYGLCHGRRKFAHHRIGA